MDITNGQRFKLEELSNKEYRSRKGNSWAGESRPINRVKALRRERVFPPALFVNSCESMKLPRPNLQLKSAQ